MTLPVPGSPGPTFSAETRPEFRTRLEQLLTPLSQSSTDHSMILLERTGPTPEILRTSASPATRAFSSVPNASTSALRVFPDRPREKQREAQRSRRCGTKQSDHHLSRIGYPCINQNDRRVRALLKEKIGGARPMSGARGRGQEARQVPLQYSALLRMALGVAIKRQRFHWLPTECKPNGRKTHSSRLQFLELRQQKN